MKTRYHKLAVLVAFGSMLLLGAATGLCETSVQVVPWPLSVKCSEGAFTLSQETIIVADKGSADLANYAQKFLSTATGYKLPVRESSSATAARANAITLQTAALPEDLGKEGYELSVTTSGVVIRAAQPAGLFYGIQTLRQLLPSQIESRSQAADIQWIVPCVEIQDTPRFKWRGLMLDCSRTFQSIDYLKKTIDLMAMFKMNVLHLHLTDDQGWRLEIKKYPELTQKGARFPEKWNEPPEHEGFYTQEQMKDLVAYASARAITIVPEIELPGHTLAALAAYPQLSCTGGPFEIHPFKKGPGIHDDLLCAGNEETFVFLENVFKEVLEIFPSEYIHIGGDEAPKNKWKVCPKCQQRIQSEKLSNEQQLQSYFVSRIGIFLKKNGRIYMGWDDIIGSGLRLSPAIMSWRGMGGGLRAAASGSKAVMTPTTHCYFDYTYQRIDTRKAYSFEPVPDSVKPEDQKNILGVQANFWSHIDREPHLVDRQLWPRLIGIAERGWSEKTIQDWDNFSKRLEAQYPRLQAADVHYFGR